MLMVSASAKSRLPTGFREVQWLQGSGTQYCVTDIPVVYSATDFTSIKGNVTVLDSNTSKFEIGTYWSTTSPSSQTWRYGCAFSYAQSLSSGTYAPTLFFRFGRTNSANATVNMSNFVYPLDIHFEINKNTLVHNGGTSQKPADGVYYNSNIMSRTLVIGGCQVSGGSINVFNTGTQYKTLYIYNNDTLLYEFVPCYRKEDGKTGFMKITVADGSAVFFPNMGEDEWIIGTVV